MTEGIIMKILILVVLVLASVPVNANDVRAVVNPDGSVSYFTVKVGDSTKTGAVTKGIAKAYLTGNLKDLKVYELKAFDDSNAGFVVAAGKSDGAQPVFYAMDNGIKAVATNYDALPEAFGNAYTLASEKGNVSTLWFTNDSQGSAVALDKLIPPRWSISKVAAISDLGNKIADAIPIPREKFLKDLGDSMLAQATSLACKSKVRPKDISVTASLAASIGLIVGGEGTISFAATWETANLCN